MRMRPDLNAGALLRCCGWSPTQPRSVHVGSPRFQPGPWPAVVSSRRFGLSIKTQKSRRPSGRRLFLSI